MKKAIFALTVFLLTPSAFAGIGAAIVECKSASGKTKVEAILGDGGDSMFKVSLTNSDGKGKTVSTYVNANLAEDAALNGRKLEDIYPGAKVVTIASVTELHVVAINVIDTNLKYDSNLYSFVSTPNNFKVKKERYGGLKGTFEAKISGHDPREGSRYGYFHDIKLSCTYDYSI